MSRRNGVVNNCVGEEDLTLNFVNEEYKVSIPALMDQKRNCCAKVLIVDDEYFNIFAL